MTNGKRYQIVMAPSAHRRYKKFSSSLQVRIKEESQRLSERPYDYDELKGRLKGIRSYHFNYEGVSYRIAYRIEEQKKRIEIVLVNERENFYKILRRVA